MKQTITLWCIQPILILLFFFANVCVCVVTRLTGYAESLCIPDQISALFLHPDQSDWVKAGQDAAVEATCTLLDTWEHNVKGVTSSIDDNKMYQNTPSHQCWSGCSCIPWHHKIPRPVVFWISGQTLSIQMNGGRYQWQHALCDVPRTGVLAGPTGTDRSLRCTGLPGNNQIKIYHCYMTHRCYWIRSQCELTVQLYFTQSSQKRLAENFLRMTTVKPKSKHWPAPMIVPVNNMHTDRLFICCNDVILHDDMIGYYNIL